MVPESYATWANFSRMECVPMSNGLLAKSRKLLYSLRQASNLWYHVFYSNLLKAKFSLGKHSEILFIGGKQSNFVYIVAYIYYLLVIGLEF